MRKTLAYILCLTLLFAAFPLSVNAESREVVLLENQFEIVEDGQVVGNSFKTITRTIKNEIVYLNVIEVKQYDDGRIIENSEVTTIQLVNDNEAVINGETVYLSDEEYSLEDQNQMTPFYVVNASGGRYSYTTWEDRFDSNYPPSPHLTSMTSASGLQNRVTNVEAMFLDYGGAKNDAITRIVFKGESEVKDLKVINFKYYAGNVVAARNTINATTPLLMAALGVTVLTSASVIGAIAGTVTVAGLAVAIWDAGNNADSSMATARAILTTL